MNFSLTIYNTISPVKSVGDNGAVKMIANAGSNADGYILVMPGATPGNAVVSASVGGKIVWSWHIWVVANYNPDPATDIWMDRNLGATTNTPATLSTMGLYYQWGRKDPIPGAKSINQVNYTPGCTYYLSDNTSTTTVPWSTTGTGTLINSISDPLQNYDNWTGSTGNPSWITGYKNEYDTGPKTIYDPCPDGWRVPVRINQTNTASTHHWGNEVSGIGDKWNNVNGYGINWSAKGGYCPATGHRYSGGLYAVGSSGYYWSASPNGSIGYHLSFDNNTVIPNFSNSRYHGFSVRCVRW